METNQYKESVKTDLRKSGLIAYQYCLQQRGHTVTMEYLCADERDAQRTEENYLMMLEQRGKLCLQIYPEGFWIRTNLTDPRDELRIVPTTGGIAVSYFNESCCAPWIQTKEELIFKCREGITFESHISYLGGIVPYASNIRKKLPFLAQVLQRQVPTAIVPPDLSALVKVLEQEIKVRK